MHSFLRVWSFLDENKGDFSFSDISKRSDMSYVTVLDGVKKLEVSKMVVVDFVKNKKIVIRTKLFFSSRKFMKNLYDSCNQEKKTKGGRKKI